jgi:glycosyltransferase involved in cell wall biosynthesis
LTGIGSTRGWIRGAGHHRITFVSHAADVGGAEICMLDLMDAGRFRSQLVLMSDGQLADEARRRKRNISFVNLHPRLRRIRRDSTLQSLTAPIGLFASAIALSHHIGRNDVVVANSQKAFVVAAVARLRQKFPLVWHLHDIIDASSGFSWLNERVVIGLANARADVVVANSKAAADAFIRAGGCADKVKVVYNGINPAPFAAVDRQHAAVRLRASLGLPEARIIAMFGRITPWKGHSVFLEALARVPGALGLIVGGVSEAELAYEAALKARAGEPDLCGRVLFLGFRADIPQLMSGVDAVVHASTMPEPFGRVIVEAMLARAAVIATDAGGVAEIISDGRNGRLVPPNDVESLAAAIKDVFANPARNAAMTQAAMTDARLRFGPEAFVDGMMNAFEQAVVRARGASKRAGQIVFVNQTGEIGGGELSLLELIRSQQVPGRLLLLTGGPLAGMARDAGVEVCELELEDLHRIKRTSGVVAVSWAFPAVVNWARAVRRATMDADLIYANSQKAFVLSALAFPGGRKIVWHLRDIIGASAGFSWLNRRGAIWLANWRADAVIANSKATADAFITAGGRPAKVRIVYNGIDPRPFEAVDRARAATVLRAALGATEELLFGIFGRVTPWKGQDVFLEALARVPCAHGIIVGLVDEGNRAFEAALRTRAERSDLRGRVHFLGYRKDIPELMCSVNAVVHASTQPEPFGRVIVEAMLAGTIVIATDAGGVPEIIESGLNGILVPPNDVDALARAMSDIIARPAATEALRCAALALATKRFTPANYVGGVLNVLREATDLA